MTTDAEDRSTWPRNGQAIRRDELLRLIEDNGGPDGLDLRGAILVGDGPSDKPSLNPIDLSREALAPLAAAYRQANGGADPPWLTTEGGISLGGARLQGAHLNGAQLQGARLSYAALQGAHLNGAQLQGAHLDGAQLQGAHLWYAQLQGAYLSGAQLQGVVMYDVRTLDDACWYDALLDHTLIKRESLGKAIGDEIEARQLERPQPYAYHNAKEAYLLLKSNFNQIGRYEDASWAYVKEQQMEKMAFYWECRSHEWRFWRAWGSFWRWLRNWAYELATGYGERPWLPALWAIVVVAAFTIIYASAGNISPDFAGDPAAAQGSHNFLDALTHSIGAFATIGFNTLEPLGWGARLLTAVESALGISLFALFIFTIGNRMSRG